jgi:hypothetical protein
MATHSLHFLLVAVVGPVAAMAEEPLAKGIQDNSFLIEEAYNQEPASCSTSFNLPSFFTGHAHEIMPSLTQECRFRSENSAGKCQSRHDGLDLASISLRVQSP